MHNIQLLDMFSVGMDSYYFRSCIHLITELVYTLIPLSILALKYLANAALFQPLNHSLMSFIKRSCGLSLFMTIVLFIRLEAITEF